MKKLCTLLALIMLLTCVPMTGCTAEPEPNPATDFEYEIGEDGNVTITKYIGQTANVVIPAQIEEKNVTRIEGTAFSYNQSIKSLVIPPTITALVPAAFLLCTSLETVTLPKTLLSIGNGAFEECTALSEITLPSHLQSIGTRAFAMCSSLKEINIPGNCFSDICFESFAGAGLETVIFEGSIDYIPRSTFGRCYNLSRIYFEENAPSVFCYLENNDCIIYYHKDAQGFTSPEWNGYPTEIW